MQMLAINCLNCQDEIGVSETHPKDPIFCSEECALEYAGIESEEDADEEVEVLQDDAEEEKD